MPESILIPEPNYTQIPNVIFEYWMSRLKHTDFKVLLCICRQTFGYHKIADPLSYNQIEKKTGISRRQIIDSIKNLLEFKLLEKIESVSEQGDSNPNVYKINVMSIEQCDGEWCRNCTTQCEDCTTGSAGFAPTKEKNTKQTDCIVCSAEAPSEKSEEKKETKIIFPHKNKAVIGIMPNELFAHLSQSPHGFTQKEIEEAMQIIQAMDKRPKLTGRIESYVEGIILKQRKQKAIEKSITNKNKQGDYKCKENINSSIPLQPRNIKEKSSEKDTSGRHLAGLILPNGYRIK